MPGQTNLAIGFRPCVVLAHSDASFAQQTSREFRQLGWDVYHARSGAGARKLARKFGPAAVVLDADLLDESGWLVCDKLSREQPNVRVFIVGARTVPVQRRFAAFVGAAALLRRQDSVAA